MVLKEWIGLRINIIRGVMVKSLMSWKCQMIKNNSCKLFFKNSIFRNVDLVSSEGMIQEETSRLLVLIRIVILLGEDW